MKTSLFVLLAALFLPGCTSRGEAGLNESCVRTKDCVAPLRCVRPLNLFRQAIGPPRCEKSNKPEAHAYLSGHREACGTKADCIPGSKCLNNMCINQAAYDEEVRRIRERVGRK